ncbi:tyrosine-type recombinase/integrase [Streptomyces sp. NPDC007971]|uniref:tyrosine-type recombinase/integrase n=1 Tax=Streptomyces sp. NPDC007971 TaxID=3364799 RepID=UPI0036EC0F73
MSWAPRGRLSLGGGVLGADHAAQAGASRCEVVFEPGEAVAQGGVRRRTDNPNRALAKSRSPRIVPVTADLTSLYTDYQYERHTAGADGGDMVFVNLFRPPVGRPMSYPNTKGMFDRLAREADHPFRPHMLRHSAATTWLRSGVDRDVVQRLLGHLSPLSMERYWHVCDTETRQAVERVLDPKGAPHDIVQAIGRALRQKPGQGKLASLIVPVFLQPGERPEDMFTSASYRPLVKVLEGLRAHDEEAVELLAIPQEPQKDVAQPSVNIGAAPEDGEEESRLLLRFAVPRDPVMVADWVSFNVIDTEKQDWARGWAALKKFTELLRVGHRSGDGS